VKAEKETEIQQKINQADRRGK